MSAPELRYLTDVQLPDPATWAKNGTPFVVSDGLGILAVCDTEHAAAEFIGTLPSPESGRYNLDGPPDDY
jgi:hypothetical protein